MNMPWLKLMFLTIAAMLTGLSAAEETAATDIRDGARRSYEAFLQLSKIDDPRRPGAFRRLADMELQRAEELMVEGGQDEEAMDVYAHSIRLYEKLLGDYPDHEHNDEVRYQLARAQEAVGDMEGARVTLTRLVDLAPESGFAEEGEFRRGESLFSDGQYEAAVNAYSAVIEMGEAGKSPKAFLEQAWYKHGWSLFKLTDFSLSQSSFLKLLRHNLAPAGNYDDSQFEKMSRGSREMIADALRAMSLGFSYGDGVNDVNALLDKDSAPGFEHLLFQDLGNLYRKEERYQDAALAYHAFVERLPNAKHAAHMQLDVIETYNEAGFSAQALQAKEDFAEVYALDREGETYWTHHSKEDAADIVTALKLHLTELTRHYHAQSQETRDPLVFEQAYKWYRAWLGSFPAEPESSQTHFLLAELLFDGGAFDQAVAAYEYTAYQYEAHPRAAEAAYAALLAYEKHANNLTLEQQGVWEQQSIASALKFTHSFSDHEQATAVQSHAAERLFERGQLEDALLAARELLQWQPPATTAQQHTAWLISGHAHFDQLNFAESEKSYQQALNTASGNDEDQQSIVERLAASVYKQAEAQLAAGQLQRAVSDFLRVLDVAPQSSLVAAAEYEAASVLMDLKDFATAATVLEAFRMRYPNHELQRDVTRNLSVSYLQSGESEKAAEELMRMARDPVQDDATRLQAAWQAAELYKTSGDTEQLVQSYVYLLDDLGISLDEEIEVREEIAGVFQKMGNESQYLSWVRSIIDSHKSAGSAATPRSLTAAANATLMFAEREWSPFVTVRLQEPLQENLKLKKQRMETLLQKFGDAAAYNVGPVTTAATWRIASAYAEMADALMTSERPGELSELELEQYEFLLEEQAFPFEEQAIEVHENNIQRVENGIYDIWVRKSFADLAELMPGRYQKIEKGVSVANLLN